MGVLRTTAVVLLVASSLLTGCKSAPEAASGDGAATAETAAAPITAACTLPNAEAAPTNVKAIVPGVGEFAPATPEEGKAHTLVATHDPATRTAKIAFELQLAPGQRVADGEMITFEFDRAGWHEEVSVRVNNR